MSLINQMLKDLEARRNQTQPDPNLLLNLRSATTFPTTIISKNHFVIITAVVSFGFFISLCLYLKSITFHSHTSIAPAHTPKLMPPTAEILAAPPLAEFENIKVDHKDNITHAELSFSRPFWYDLHFDNTENKLVLSVEGVSFTKICKDPNTVAQCLDNLFLADQENLSIKVNVIPNETNQYELAFMLPEKTVLEGLNFDDQNYKLTLDFNRAPANATSGDALPDVIVRKNTPKILSPEEEYKHAWKLIQTHQIAQGLTELEILLTRNPTFKPARITLASLFIQLGRYADANQVIHSGKLLFPRDIDLTMVQARLYLAQNQPLQAQKLLESSLPAFNNHLDYYALLAAAFEKNQRPHEAIAVYQKLLLARPTQSSWWLGLAMAKEEIGEKNSALEAYQHALAYQQLSPAVQGYIINRIHVLGE